MAAAEGEPPGTPQMKRRGDDATEATPDRPGRPGVMTRSKKRSAEFVVLEPARPLEPQRQEAQARPSEEAKRPLLPRAAAATRGLGRKVPRLGQQALEQLVEDFADDYFSAPRSAPPPSGASSVNALILGAAARDKDVADASSEDQDGAGADTDCREERGGEAGAREAAAAIAQPPRERWLGLLRLGFSLLVQGAGSKRRLLEGFADEVLLPWGASLVRIDGYNKRLSLVECLRDVLDVLHPGTPPGTSAESLLAALRTARAAAPAPVRPLCFVVHSIDVMPEAQQANLAALAAMPGVHLLASADSIWAPLAWQAATLRDFNFVYVAAHTYEDYAAEAAARYPGGRPAWCDPDGDRQEAPRASVGLVLKSLTQNHRELVEAIAQHQADSGGRGGISKSKLLGIASNRMIAATVGKLTMMLNELRDHEVIANRSAADGGSLIYLPYDSQTVRRLAELSTTPFEDEEEESEDEGDAQSEQGGA